MMDGGTARWLARCLVSCLWVLPAIGIVFTLKAFKVEQVSVCSKFPACVLPTTFAYPESIKLFLPRLLEPRSFSSTQLRFLYCTRPHNQTPTHSSSPRPPVLQPLVSYEQTTQDLTMSPPQSATAPTATTTATPTALGDNRGIKFEIRTGTNRWTCTLQDRNA